MAQANPWMGAPAMSGMSFNPGQALQGGLGFIGGLIDSERGRSQANKNRDMQIAFAKKGIQWRVQDAMKAGVHPLAALGASMQGYAPVSVGSDFAGMGQNLGRALSATSNVDDRLTQLTLRNMELRNQLIEGQIARMQQSQIGPGVPYDTGTMTPLIAGQGDVSAPPFQADPRVALVVPPDPRSNVIKSFGFPLIANPRHFTRAEGFEDQFGEEGPPGWIHNTASYLDALSRAVINNIRSKNPWLSTRIMSDRTRRFIFEGR